MSAPTNFQTIGLDKIRTNGGTQTRVQLNAAAVKEYGEAMTEGVKFPPVTVFFDGTDYWLADGFHRVQASMDIGALSIEVDVRPGDQRDARLFSASANESHGVRRTYEDKRRSVQVLLDDPEWSKWTDREIARQCKVAHPLVASMRPHLEELPDRSATGQESDRSAKAKKVSRGGKTYEMKTAGIAESNQSRAKEAPAETTVATPLEKPSEAPGPVEKAPTAAAVAKAAKAESKALEENATLKARIAELEEELDGYKTNCADLADEVKALSAAVDPNHARKFLEQSGYVRTLESQRDDWMNKATMLTREVKSLRKKLGKTEGDAR